MSRTLAGLPLAESGAKVTIPQGTASFKGHFFQTYLSLSLECVVKQVFERKTFFFIIQKGHCSEQEHTPYFYYARTRRKEKRNKKSTSAPPLLEDAEIYIFASVNKQNIQNKNEHKINKQKN